MPQFTNEMDSPIIMLAKLARHAIIYFIEGACSSVTVTVEPHSWGPNQNFILTGVSFQLKIAEISIYPRAAQ